MRALTASLFVALAAGLAAQGVPPPPPPPPPPPMMFNGEVARDTMKPPPTGTSVMSGVILSDESAPQPIRRARVSINNADGTVFKTAVTDDAGRYSFTRLPAGRYSLSATKPGYVRMNYGARRADRPGTMVLVADAQKVAGLDVKLARGGVITGRVLDETGQPAFGVNVSLLQYRMQQGERTLQRALTAGGLASDTTDDRGVYRLYGLPAGEYVLSAQPRATTNMEIRAMTDQEVRAAIQAAQQNTGARGTGAGQTAGVPGSTPPATPREYTTVGYTPVFFPSTPIASNAAPIVIAPGEERSNVDVQIQLVRTARLEGTVVTPPGIPPQTVTLTMTASGPNANAGSLLGFSILNRATPGQDGKFTYTSVPPGQYTISARATERPQGGRGGAPAAGRGDTFEFQTRVVGTAVGGGGGEPMVFTATAPPGQGPVFWGTLDVGVNGQNLSNLNISLQPGLTLAGRVQFDGKKLAPPTDVTRTRLNMMPVQTGNIIALGGLPAATIDASGKFTITGIVPGRYRLDGSSPMTVGQGWMVKSIVARGRDIFDFPLEIGPGDEITDAVVTFTDVTQEVAGTLQDPTGRPAPDYSIVIFPADNRLWSSPVTRRIRTVRPGTDGKFTIANLPAGEYRLAALTDITPGDQTDPSFLQQLVVASIPITLADGEKKVQDIRIGG